ncbi:MAG: PDDEXK nuclease domain-containing protein [Lachnospiraceae bacterium]|nr:PDDEXK nuclease domain-containing protein [Lachnospiraceae bacterium]
MQNKKLKSPVIVSSHDVHLDSDYIQWIYDIKERFRGAQIKASVKVNSEQLLFNWQLGRDIVLRKSEEKWGHGIVEQLSLDLQHEFPEVKGFSARNLWNMKKWYSFYAFAGDLGDLIRTVNNQFNFDSIKLQQLGAEIKENNREEKLHQTGAEMEFPGFFGFVPWRHHVEIVSRCNSVEEALFYLERTIEEGWSRNALIDCIKSDLYYNKGVANTNFAEKLPGIQGRIAQEIVKDTYDFSFISLPGGYDETALEAALEQNITRFLLELGTGFAFIGRQKEIIVSGKTRKIDMLFYHIRLKCYVVVELKAVSFEPEFAGKLNFYVNAVNDLIRTADENPTIGLLICKDKNQTEVQWAFQGIQTPMGVASYDNIKLEEIKKQLPTEKEIQRRIELAEEEFNLNRKKQGR